MIDLLLAAILTACGERADGVQEIVRVREQPGAVIVYVTADVRDCAVRALVDAELPGVTYVEIMVDGTTRTLAVRAAV